MRKQIYFTEGQEIVLDKLKMLHKLSNAEVVREAIKELALKYDIDIPDNYATIDSRRSK